jgi:hypothetical protein
VREGLFDRLDAPRGHDDVDRSGGGRVLDEREVRGVAPLRQRAATRDHGGLLGHDPPCRRREGDVVPVQVVLQADVPAEVEERAPALERGPQPEQGRVVVGLDRRVPRVGVVVEHVPDWHRRGRVAAGSANDPYRPRAGQHPTCGRTDDRTDGAERPTGSWSRTVEATAFRRPMGT